MPAKAVCQAIESSQARCFRGPARSCNDPGNTHDLIVPTLCVGMHPETLRVFLPAIPLPSEVWARSVRGGIPTRSAGTIKQPT